jgi:Protein of unknown function (DUF3551)
LPISSLVVAASLLAAALLAVALLAGASRTASAQSPNSYPWCARIVTRNAATSCYYKTKELCMLSVSGVGGYCFENPGYRGPAAAVARPARGRRQARHS